MQDRPRFDLRFAHHCGGGFNPDEVIMKRTGGRSAARFGGHHPRRI